MHELTGALEGGLAQVGVALPILGVEVQRRWGCAVRIGEGAVRTRLKELPRKEYLMRR